jgi:hypothetical protein
VVGVVVIVPVVVLRNRGAGEEHRRKSRKGREFPE